MRRVPRPAEIPTDHFTGSDLEDRIDKRLDTLHELRMSDISKYGVKVRFDPATNAYRPIKSLPDYEGPWNNRGQQAIFDAKVCSAASFALNKYRIEEHGPKSQQLKKLHDRAEFGCTCFFLIHWNQRVLAKRTVPPATYAMPVIRSHPFWMKFERRDVNALTRTDMLDYAVEVQWNYYGDDRTARPDVLAAIERMAGNQEPGNVRMSGRWAI